MLIDAQVQILLGVFDNYSSIQVEISESRQITILHNLREASLSLNLPVQNIYDQLYNTKPHRKTPQMNSFSMQAKNCSYSIRIKYSQASNRNSYWASKGQDMFQGEQLGEQFKRDEFRIQKNRFRRILYSCQLWTGSIKDLVNFKYPFQSYFFYAFTLLVILFFDLNYVLHCCVLLMLTLLAYCHPSFTNYYRQIVFLLGWTNKVEWISKMLRHRPFTPKFKVSFKKDVQKRNFLENFNMTTKKKRNIIEKYHLLNYWLLKGQLFLTYFVSLAQKLKNTFMWEHHSKTKDLFLALGILLLVIAFVPIRCFLLFGLYKTFKKGLCYQKQVQRMNKLILGQVFRICIQENGLADMKPFWLLPHESINKKLTQYMQFEKKVKQCLQGILQIQFDPEIFTQGKSMNDMLEALSHCSRRFLIKEEICLKYKFNLEWSRGVSSLTKALMVAYGFLLNIPSDRNIRGVKRGEQEEKNDEDDSDDQLTA